MQQGEHTPCLPVSNIECRTRPTHRQTSCREGCRGRQTSREGGKNSGLLYLPASSMSQEWPGEPWSLAAGSPARLLASEAPCPSADYRSSLAHSAFSMRGLQETPPGNLYLQGWQTAISSITGWLRETEPIKWILESSGVFTSVISKGEEKKSLQCGVDCTFQKEAHMLCRAHAAPQDATADRSRGGRDHAKVEAPWTIHWTVLPPGQV